MNARNLPLRLEFLPASDPTPTSSGAHVLGTVFYGESPPAPHGGVRVVVPLDSLDDEPLAEVWTTDQKPIIASHFGFETAETSELIFGSASLEVDDPEAAARSFYLSLFDLLEERGFPNLLRIWNIVPRIGEDRGGIDRYMHFCRGRALAFEERHGRGFEGLLPAASAVGSDRDPFVVWFVASKAAGLPIENPRQMSAFKYPERFGPKPPSFARATLAPEKLGSDLLLSGTASILGCESVHLDDRSAQLAETMENIRALLGKHGKIDSNHLRQLKVFVRDRPDTAGIRSALSSLSESGTQLMFLRADICRPELLLEIEGIGRRAPSEAPATGDVQVAH